MHAGLVPPVDKKCAIGGCGQNRIALDCASQWCRKHCVALYEGFCPSKKHRKPGSASASAVPSSGAPSAPVAIPSTSVPTTIPALLPSSPPTSSNPADIHPCFSSPLSPAFLDVLARDHELREEKRFQEVKRLENERRAWQTVKVFVWRSNGQEPIVAHFQTGFIWPFFNVSYFVLERVGLVEPTDTNRLEYFNDDAYVGYWTRLEVGHIFEVREGHSIFLRTRNVTNCCGFQEHLAHFRSTAPIFYSQLAREREYIRNNLPAYDTWTIPSTPKKSKKRKASSSPEVVSSPSAASASSVSPKLISSSPIIIEVKPKSRSLPVLPPMLAASTSAANPGSSLYDVSAIEWPRDYYVCDIVDCFKDCKTSVKRGGRKTRTLKVVFAEYFPGVNFKPSTYHDQRNFWLGAPESLKKRFYEGGRIKAAKWSAFAAAVRKQSAATRSMDDVIDLTD